MATAPASDPEANDSLPSDLMELSLEDLMGLRVGSRGHSDADDASLESIVPVGVLPAAALAPGGGAGSGPGGATGGRPGSDDLPADLTALSLTQLMSLPLRAPQPESEEGPDDSEEDAEEGETVPEVAQTESGQEPADSDAPPPPPAAAGAAFGEPDLDGDAEAGAEEPLGLGEGADGDPDYGTASPGAAGGVRLAALLEAHGDAGSDSALALGAIDLAPGGGGGGNLTLIGGAGDDALTGGAGDDSLSGLDGNDSLTGNGGADTLIGGAGRDTLLGGAGNDALDGGNGKDLLDGGAGSDTLAGGNGSDSLVWDLVDSVIDGGNGQDTLLAGGGNVDLRAFTGSIASIETVEMAGDGAGTRLTLDVQDVIDMSSNDTLTVSGDAGDSVDAGTGWTDFGITGAVHVYTQGLARLEVDLDVTVNPDILA